MKYIEIKNIGLIEAEALTLVGASTKVGDKSKIGQFGSGNKYALAYFLRNNFDIKIFSGMEEILISTKPANFRNAVFNVIHVNGKETSITSEMGKDWELWQSIREIYCNALDESEASFEVVESIEPNPEETHFYIECNREIESFLLNFDNYFSINKNVLFECADGQILAKSGTTANLYRKGIKCYITNNDSLFDYNFNEIDVDENRLIKYSWTVDEKIWGLIFQCTNLDVLKEIFLNLKGNKYLEARVSDLATITTRKMSPECREYLRSIKLCPDGYSGLLKGDEIQSHCIIPTAIFNSVRSFLNERSLGSKFRNHRGGVYREFEPDSAQAAVIENALSFLKLHDFYIPYLVKTAIFDNKQIYGTVDEETIILSDVGLEKGVTEVINTIIEEYIHIKHGVEDETRGFQTAIITEFIAYMKKTTTKGVN